MNGFDHAWIGFCRGFGGVFGVMGALIVLVWLMPSELRNSVERRVPEASGIPSVR